MTLIFSHLLFPAACYVTKKKNPQKTKSLPPLKQISQPGALNHSKVTLLISTDESRSSLQGALECTMREWVMSIYSRNTCLFLPAYWLPANFSFVIAETVTSVHFISDVVLFYSRWQEIFPATSPYTAENDSNFPVKQICIIQLSWTVDDM